MKGRLITDNVIDAFKIFHWLQTRSNTDDTHFALKLVMAKAFDRIKWHFLKLMLHDIGFPNNFCRKIIDYVRTVLYPYKWENNILF